MDDPPKERPHPVKLDTVPGYLPLNDAPMTTRGQVLPALIQERSYSNIEDIKRRRRIRIDGEPVGEGHETESDGEGLDLRRQRSLNTNRKLSSYMRRGSALSDVNHTSAMPAMRSHRLIGKPNPRYQWEKYYKSKEELRHMKKPLRQYYERNNRLIQSYLYIDRLLDSSLPHDLISEYNEPTHGSDQPQSDLNHPRSKPSCGEGQHPSADVVRELDQNGERACVKVKRTPKALYKLPNERTPLMGDDNEGGAEAVLPGFEDDEDGDADSGSRTVTVAIYINLVANIVLLAGKIAVIVLTSSLSVLASLVDAALDFLSTAIVWTTTKLITQQAPYSYPVGRRRLEPIGVLVFSVIMITSFFQVFLECFNRLTSSDHAIVSLGLPSVVIMALTVVIKLLCWFWCRLIKNSSVQALAQDAITDVVFNTFSIIFPIVGYYRHLWWLDALGGLLLSLYVIVNWSRTSSTHIRHLTGAAASPDDRNVLLYLTMRFAKSIKGIQGCQAYHAGDKLNVEVDIVLDESMALRDSHDLGESLQYVLESVPSVDRAWVHLDYKPWNLPSHLSQQSD